MTIYGMLLGVGMVVGVTGLGMLIAVGVERKDCINVRLLVCVSLTMIIVGSVFAWAANTLGRTPVKDANYWEQKTSTIVEVHTNNGSTYISSKLGDEVRLKKSFSLDDKGNFSYYCKDLPGDEMPECLTLKPDDMVEK